MNINIFGKKMVLLNEEEAEKTRNAIEERLIMLKDLKRARVALKSHGESICKLLDIYEDPITSEKEKQQALWAIRHLSETLIEVVEA